jgi:hypothetical protein
LVDHSIVFVYQRCFESFILFVRAVRDKFNARVYIVVELAVTHPADEFGVGQDGIVTEQPPQFSFKCIYVVSPPHGRRSRL